MRERKLNRLQGYDYSQDNLFFVTSCVNNRMSCFGTIYHGEMTPNDYGQIAEKQWRWLNKQYPYVFLHAFVVMPNHIHGIIEIYRAMIRTAGTGGDIVVGTGRDLSLQQPTVPKIKSLSELMGAYKTTVSKQIHLVGFPEFAWQRSFYDHIIRDETSYQNIINYILKNPSKWEDDEFYNDDK